MSNVPSIRNSAMTVLLLASFAVTILAGLIQERPNLEIWPSVVFFLCSLPTFFIGMLVKPKLEKAEENFFAPSSSFVDKFLPSQAIVPLSIYFALTVLAFTDGYAKGGFLLASSFLVLLLVFAIMVWHSFDKMRQENRPWMRTE